MAYRRLKKSPDVKLDTMTSDKTHLKNRTGVVVATLCTVLLVGCSSTKLAYRYADWGVVWWVEDYVSLTAEQEQRLASDLQALQQWHCQAELPRYSQWLSALASDISKGATSPATVQYHQQQLLGFVPPLLEQIVPIATRLLASLTDAQVRELATNMAAKQRELEQELLPETPEARAAARAERTRERLENWLGPLNTRQTEIVARWSANRNRQTEIWLAGRRAWQSALLDALADRHSSDFDDRVRHLLVHSERVRGPDYQRMRAESEQAMTQLIHDLLQAADQAQLRHLAGRAGDLRGDFEALSCTPVRATAEAPDQTVR